MNESTRNGTAPSGEHGETDPPAVVLFAAIMATAVVGAPIVGVLLDFTITEWALFAALYLVCSGVGIMVRHRRLTSQQTAEDAISPTAVRDLEDLHIAVASVLRAQGDEADALEEAALHPDSRPRRAKAELDVPAVMLFAGISATTLIGVPLFAWLHGYSTTDWVMFAVLYLVSGLGITVGYHRLLSHRSFECATWVKAGFLITGGWALQNSALVWCADHIRHHARCDRHEDPYNATRGFWHSHCGWIFEKTIYRDRKYETRLRGDPLIMWQDRYYLPIVASGLALPFIVGLISAGWTGGLGCFLLAGLGRTFVVLNSTFCINSICHLWGRQPHGTQDTSRDSWWVSLVTMGEGYHNYHHKYRRDYRNGPNWYNFDPSKWLIYLLSKARVVRNLQRARRQG